MTVASVENRIALLRSRKTENTNIIAKLERQLRRLKEENNTK